MKRIAVGLMLCVAGALPGYASAAGVQHLHFRAGPYKIAPGSNLILLDSNQVPKPAEDGFMIRMAPNLHYALPNGGCCGAIPRVDVIHLHHGVWLSNGAAGRGEGNGYAGGFYPFMAAGEEKTVFEFPRGYGYPIGAHDIWLINYMIHDLTNKGARVFITYDIDFIPKSARPRPRSSRCIRSGWTSSRAISIRCSTCTASAGRTASSPTPTWRPTRTDPDRR